MWISKKKWQMLEKRVADLEEKLQSQPQEFAKVLDDHLRKQLTKSSPPHQWRM